MKKVLAILLALLMVFSLVACGETATESAPQAEQQPEKVELAWPEKPITLLVSGKAGGGIDLQARVYAAYLEKALGKPVVVQNGSNTEAYQQLKSAAPDGYTYLFTSAAFFIQEGLGSLGFTFDDSCDAVNVFSTSGTNGLYARADGPYKTLDDYMKAGQAKPGNVQLGIAAATYFHVFPAAMEKGLGIDFDLIDAGTDNERTLALVGAQVDVISSQYSNAIRPYVESGEVVCLGVAQDARNAAMPDVPTFKECGYDFSYPGQVMFVVAPKGVDTAILEKLADSYNGFCGGSDFLADVANLGVESYPAASHADVAKLMKELHDTFVESTSLIVE